MELGKNISKTQKLTVSAIVIAIYVVTMFFTQSFAFGAVQVRIATTLYSLAYLCPFLVLPLGLSNIISNMVLGGLGIFDILGGFIVGVITSYLIYLVKKYKLSTSYIALIITFVPGLIVPIWLSLILHVPYYTLAISLCLGQVIPGICGVFLVNSIKNKFL